jgi:hypothetical protein
MGHLLVVKYYNSKALAIYLTYIIMRKFGRESEHNHDQPRASFRSSKFIQAHNE